VGQVACSATVTGYRRLGDERLAVADVGQNGGAAARRVRPGLRSLRSPAAAGAIDGPFAGAAVGRDRRSLRKRGLAHRGVATLGVARRVPPAPRRLKPRGSAALSLTRTELVPHGIGRR
jgi:hypothetical protein